ncbi:MAG: sarcosine oxidase subunit delta [Hyphomicrobiales bacterium]
MLVVSCPVCGVVGEEADFHYGGQAHVRRPASHDPANITDAQQRDYLFMRHNPKGIHFERWRCDRGCGKWFNAVRDTVTLDFKAYYGATELPPLEWMKQATGEWAQFFAPKIAALEAQAAAPTASAKPASSRTRKRAEEQ